MVKFGKEFRKYQVKQWKDSYINYKLLKQEIRKIKNNIEQEKEQSRPTNLTEISDIGHPSIKPIELVPDDSAIIETQDLHSLYNRRYGNELKNFIDLLEKEFRKCYIHFVGQEKELYKRVNGHCFASVMYKEYNIINIFNEIKEIVLTVKLAKQLNCFINDNVMALKKILKKFDKKYQRYFGIIGPKYILTHLTSQNSDLEYLLQFKLIDETTTICDNNLKVLLDLYKRLRGNNININNISNEDRINDSLDNSRNNSGNKKIINYNNLDNNINYLKRKINEFLDSIDEITYFKIQYREWFYYAKQNKRLVKNNPKIFENDIYNPVLSSTYHKDSLLEKCISLKSALNEIERSQSPLSHSNTINLFLIYTQAAVYNSMLTNILPVISNYFYSYIKSDFDTLFLLPIIIVYISYLFPFTLFVYLDSIDKNNVLMQISYIISYILIFISSSILLFVNDDHSDKVKNFILILISRFIMGFANNQMLNKKYITLYLPKFRLPYVSKNYLRAELNGLILGPIITLIISPPKNEFSIFGLKYTEFNCIGWYGLIISLICGILHFIFFIRPLSDDFIMVKDESNISGNKFYQRSESEISRKQYLKEQNQIYKKQYNSIKKKNKENQKLNENNNDIDNLIIKNVNKNDDDIEKNNDNLDNNNIIKKNTKDDLIEKLLDNNENDENDKNVKNVENVENVENDENKNNQSHDSEEMNTSLDVSSERNVALNPKQQNMINELERVLEKKNEESNFNDMNQIPSSITSIINKEKKSLGYINQNLLILYIMFFCSSLIKTNSIFNYLWTIQDRLNSNTNIKKWFCLFIFLLFVFKVLTIFFIFPFYQVNYKYKLFMLISVACLLLFNLLLIVNSIYDDNNTLFIIFFIILNILLVFGCNIIDISCSCYLSFILSPEWKILGRNIGHWNYYIIILGKIVGGMISFLLSDKGNSNIWVLVGITCAFFISFLILTFFTRILQIKGITRVIRKTALEIN